MSNFWLQVKVWTKTTIAAIVVVYGIIFILKNSSDEVTFWWWFNHNESHNKLVFAFASFIGGVIVTLLVRTLWTTVRQVQSLQTRSRTSRIERDVAEMKEKAARLQTRSGTIVANTPIPGAFETPDPPTPSI